MDGAATPNQEESPDPHGETMRVSLSGLCDGGKSTCPLYPRKVTGKEPTIMK